MCEGKVLSIGIGYGIGIEGGNKGRRKSSAYSTVVDECRILFLLKGFQSYADLRLKKLAKNDEIYLGSLGVSWVSSTLFGRVVDSELGIRIE